MIFKPILALVGAAGVMFAVSPVSGQTTACPTTATACSDTASLPNPIYLAGSSAFEPILSQLAVQISRAQGVSIIYQPISSCNGVSAVSPPADLPVPQPLTGTADYYLTNKTDPTKVDICNCNLAGNTMAAIGVSDVALESCQTTARPATIGEWFGPEQAMLIVVPKANLTTTALSAEQAAAIWGCGKYQGFTDPNAIQQRSATSGTQIQIAKNIGVPEVSFVGHPNGSSSAMLTSLLSVADPQTAIGFVANDFYDTKRSVLNSVAFQGKGQNKAYYADSDSIADDLLNVREGRYMIQGPLHFFSTLTAGAPSASAALVINWLTGAAPIDPSKPGSYVTTVATSGDVPQCAMKVKLDKDGGYFSPYVPPVSCHCAFQKAKNVRLPAGACPVCKADTDCSGGLKCQTGYCE